MNAAGKDEDHQVFLGLGTNIEPQVNLPRAVELLGRTVLVEAVSAVWVTPPVGSQGPDFLNAAAHIKTRYSMDNLRERVLHPIEDKLGRVRTGDPNAPRTIDLDILIYDGVVVDDEIWEQAHICIPLSELVPDYTQPKIGITLQEHALRLIESNPRYRKFPLILPAGN